LKRDAFCLKELNENASVLFPLAFEAPFHCEGLFNQDTPVQKKNKINILILQQRFDLRRIFHYFSKEKK